MITIINKKTQSRIERETSAKRQAVIATSPSDPQITSVQVFLFAYYWVSGNKIKVEMNYLCKFFLKGDRTQSRIEQETYRL